MATAREARTGNSFRLAAVITPSVPSPPINSCFRSYPVLSFRRRFKPFQISPLGSTASSPSTSERIVP